jgi:hypothetical protein
MEERMRILLDFGAFLCFQMNLTANSIENHWEQPNRKICQSEQ